jgi:RNA polymerase sigma-70 factor (family 1)
MINNNSDLLIALSHGSVEAFDTLFMSFYPKVKKYLEGFIHDHQETENIAQDIFVELWKNREKAFQIKDFDSYLFICARNGAISYLHHTLKQESFTEVANAKSYDSADYEIMFDEILTIISKEMDEMPPRQKQVFYMNKIEGISTEEIAARLGISKRSVENYLYASVAKIKKVISAYFVLYIIIKTIFLNN